LTSFRSKYFSATENYSARFGCLIGLGDARGNKGAIPTSKRIAPCLNMAFETSRRTKLFAAAMGVAAGAAAAYIVTTERVRADDLERSEVLPGDDLIPEPIESLTHAITVHRQPEDVWPWLAQMGATRGGWYSYDTIDNGRHASAIRVVPELQQLTVGTLFPALPGVTDGFTLLSFDVNRHLVLGWRSPSGELLVTWAFVLRKMAGRSTRLIVRVRGGQAYQFYGMPRWLGRRIIPFGHFVMQRKQLLGIAARVEAL
jgi:hypothetical protein